MEVIAFGALTDDRRAQLEGGEDDPFDGGEDPTAFRPKDRHVAIADDAGRLVASTGLVTADVEVAGRRFPVVGIGGVIVNAAHRGRGLARRVVGAALEEARRLGPEFAILFCRTDRMGLYLRLGFQEIGDEVRVQQPAGAIVMHLHTMWRGLHDDAAWPPGPVLVHSLPF